MIQWRSKDKIKWIAWREKFSWIRFICKNTFLPRINSPAYSCQMCEAIRGPLQKKKKRKISKENCEYSRGGCFNNIGARYLHIPVSCFTQNGSNRGHQGPRFARLIAVLLRYATSRYILVRTKLFFKKTGYTRTRGTEQWKERQRDSVLKYFHYRSRLYFFFLFFLSKISFFLRVMEKIKKKFPGVDPGIPRICICMIITS